MPGVGTTHDIRIGDDYFMVRPGSYQKKAAPMFGARFTTGDPDYNNLTYWQHWVQNCWIGGNGAAEWQDEAMYDEAVGIDTSQHEVMMLSRDLGPNGAVRATDNWDLEGGAYKREFTIFNEQLYCLSYGSADGVTPARLYKFEPFTIHWELIRTFSSQYVRSMEYWSGYLVFGTSGSTLAKMDTAEAFTTFAKPTGVSGLSSTPYQLRSYRSRLYVPMGDKIYRLKSDFTWDGATHFYHAAGINQIDDMDIHLGFLYMVSRNGHVLRTDGNNTFDLWQFDVGIQISSVRGFDGRLFIACYEAQAGTGTFEGVLYQFSGAAVTELRRWGKEGIDISLGKLRVVGKKLMFGASGLLGFDDGFGIGSYDPVEDGFHMFATNLDSVSYTAGTAGINWLVDDVFWAGGFVWCSVRGYGVFRTRLTYKDASRYLATYDNSAAGASEGPLNGGWITSSDFDGGTPGLMKLWRSFAVEVDLPDDACSLYIEFSLDGGETWIDQGSVTTAPGNATQIDGRRYRKRYVLDNAGAPVRGTSFKWRMTLRTSDTDFSPFVRNVTIQYLPLPEPNWMWDMVLVCSEEQELHDGTIESLDTTALNLKVSTLEDLFRDQNLVHFTDMDGTAWQAAGASGVMIYDFQESVPVLTALGDGPREREIRVVLMEAV